jgi:hypothetical protein
MKIAAGIGGVALCAAIPIAAGAANWVNPPPITFPRATQPQVSALPKPTSPVPRPQIGFTAQPDVNAAPGSGLTVTRWGFSPVTPGRPVYLSMTLDGTQAAIDQMRAGRPPTIQVHWTREAASGTPNLTTELTVGQPGLASALAGEVQRQGYFQWHSWASKDTLSPGQWTVSLTYPDGTPLACGSDRQPCRFTLNVG